MARSETPEESIADALQRRGQSTQAASKEVVAALDSKHQRASRSTAKSLAHTCDAVAAEIQETGQTVVNIANTIAAETEALAELLHKHGTAIGARIEEFMTMSNRVRDKMRAAHNDILSTSETIPSLAPQTEHTDSEELEI